MKKWLIFICLVFASTSVLAYRIPRPPLLSKDWTDDDINKLNESLDDIWNLQLGEFNFDIVTTTKTNADNGDLWIIDSGITSTWIQFKANDLIYTVTGGGGSGDATVQADYLVGTSNASLTNEIALGFTDDNVIVANGSTWQPKNMPDCPDELGQHLNYNALTNTFICGDDNFSGFEIIESGLVSDVLLLLKAEGADGSTDFIDSSTYQHSVTLTSIADNNSAEIDTEYYKTGTSSARYECFNDIGSPNKDRAMIDVASSPFWSMDSADEKTVEFWFRFLSEYKVEASPPAWGIKFVASESSPQGWNITLGEGSDLIQFIRFTTTDASSSQAFTAFLDAGENFLTNKWVHVAVVKTASPNDIDIFLDGVSREITTSGSGGFGGNTDELNIYHDTGCINHSVIHWDELRITNGAQYIEDFDPPEFGFAENAVTLTGLTSYISYGRDICQDFKNGGALTTNSRGDIVCSDDEGLDSFDNPEFTSLTSKVSITIEQSDGTDILTGSVGGVVASEPMVLEQMVSNECSSGLIGAIIYNSSNHIPCYCNGIDALKMSDNTSCF